MRTDSNTTVRRLLLPDNVFIASLLIRPSLQEQSYDGACVFLRMRGTLMTLDQISVLYD